MHRTSTLTIKSVAQTGEKLGASTKTKIAFVYFPNRSIRHHHHHLSVSGKVMVAQNGEKGKGKGRFGIIIIDKVKPEPTTATFFYCHTIDVSFPSSRSIRHQHISVWIQHHHLYL
jgi:hypothetical protein